MAGVTTAPSSPFACPLRPLPRAVDPRRPDRKVRSKACRKATGEGFPCHRRHAATCSCRAPPFLPPPSNPGASPPSESPPLVHASWRSNKKWPRASKTRGASAAADANCTQRLRLQRAISAPTDAPRQLIYPTATPDLGQFYSSEYDNDLARRDSGPARRQLIYAGPADHGGHEDNRG